MVKKQASRSFFKWLYGKLPFIGLCILLAVVIFLLDISIRFEKERLAAEKKAMVKKDRPPVNVVVSEIIPGVIREQINLPGIVEPWVELNLLAEVAGKIVAVELSQGDHVQKGEVIAKVDARDYKNTLQSIRASYELAALTKKRLENLYQQNIIAKSEIDDAEAKVKSLSAEMDIAALQLERCTIIAPIAGVINKLDAKVGLYLGIADPIATLLSIDRVKVVVGIPESDVDAVRDLSSIDFTVDALHNKRIRGQKHFLSVAPDSSAQLYRLELGVDNGSGELLPGMFARVEVVKQKISAALSVPLYSVISRGDRRFVYVDEGGKAGVREVELGILEGWRVQITDGLHPGDKVVVVGHRNVDAGQELNVVRSTRDPMEIFR